jgi:integrase
MRGSIVQRGKSSWRIRTEGERGPDGKRQRRFETFHGTRKQAQTRLAQILAAGADGTLTDPSSVTVGNYLASYLDNATRVSQKSLERYRQLAAHQIIPHLGPIRLQRLRPEHLEQWHAKLTAVISARTVGHAHRLLSSVLARAVKNGTVARNVAAICKPPRVEADEVEILSPAQVPAVLEALTGSWLYAVAALALATGMRRGELLALHWCDVDLDKATLRVERSVEETKAHGLRIKPPKTKAGRRNVSLPGATVAMLRAHRAEQMRIRLSCGIGEKPELVFGTLGDELRSPNNLSSQWRRILRTRNLPQVSFHSLRHAHVSILIDQGIDLLKISRRIGHTRASITLDKYGHLVGGNDDAAAKAMEGILK